MCSYFNHMFSFIVTLDTPRKTSQISVYRRHDHIITLKKHESPSGLGTHEQTYVGQHV